MRAQAFISLTVLLGAVIANPIRAADTVNPATEGRKLPTFGGTLAASTNAVNSGTNSVSVVGTNAAAVPRARVLPTLHNVPVVVNAFQAAPESTENAFAWDAIEKTYEAKPGELLAKFSFALTNISVKEAIITGARASCGCTVASLPPTPWHLPPGASGSFDVTTDLRGKSGTIAKTVTVETSAGNRILHVTSIILPNPGVSALDRERNTKMAAADRQAVFKNDCASCHVQPALGKMGRELYGAACGICHEAEHRATMVPNLHALNKPTDESYWTTWVTHGRTNSLMPAFARAEGGPLDEKQIVSLVKFLEREFKSETTKESVPSGR